MCNFWWTTRLCDYHSLCTNKAELCATFSWSLNWKSGFWTRFEDMIEIKRNTMALLHTISKEGFLRWINQLKTFWNKYIECQETTLRKNVSFIHSLFISILVNTDSFINTSCLYFLKLVWWGILVVQWLKWWTAES